MASMPRDRLVVFLAHILEDATRRSGTPSSDRYRCPAASPTD